MSGPSRSPLKDKPLRLPGQSLDEQRRTLIADKLEPALMMAVVMMVLAAMEWFRYFRPTPPQPWLVTAIALGVSFWAGWRVYKIRPTLRALRLGADGEKAVGQYLDRLRADGYQVFHDVQGEGFNLDHVLIGPGGIFTIETKTWSKPAHGDARIRYDGERLLIGSVEPDRDPLAQARSQAKWLGALLLESTGKALPIQPVVVFPGWFVEAAAGSQREVWVMEPKGMPAFLNRQQRRMEDSDAKLAGFHLSRYVREGERRTSAA